ncbi:PHP domain-containing protein [Clostridium botulinum]|uniref:PHP domain-containing protein n=1 Tax=Clostridium botulinum TaxID=1491 RepID=UPI001C9B3753|nr:PHP domain-containing protein [Clostridium botulinum]MBY6842635.1 PHP domain-containing protein [Clostridium botulinum]
MNDIKAVPIDLNEFLESFSYQNYHRHSSYSNTQTPDSGAMNEDYAKRAKELNHSIISSCEHGFQGNYWETFNLAKQYNLKFIFCAEAYWVKNRFDKDRTNSHIILSAKNENGRRAINRILSDANIEGYYYKARVDLELLLSLPPKDVFVTSACIAFWKYEDINNIVLKLHNHFKENFMLEVQYHNTDSQKKLNKHILKLSKKHNINIIMGCDSHYIIEKQSYDRDYILEYKHIKYEDEDGWFMDYPSTKEAFNRFKKQGILTDLEILNAINNTNIFLTFENFDDLDIFNPKKIKLPSLHPEKTQKEKNEIYKKIIIKEFNNYKKENNLTKEEMKIYQEGIKNEVQTVINTKMADYFILDYNLVKDAVKHGGIITKSGRGSGVSYFTNTLLGFSKVDRFIVPVHLYPERFMSETRILQTMSLPDLDLNLGNPEVFAESQERLLGKGHSYPMIAYGTLKVKSAWKMYSGANGIEFDITNEISNQIDKYEEDLKHASEDEKDTISIYDYVDEKYHQLLKESEKYQGIIMDKKKHACGYLIYSGNIKEEIGLIKCKSETTKKEYIVALIDGKMADSYKFLKNDLLKVDVVRTNKMIADRIGIKEPSIRELMKLVKDNKKVWDIYKNGFTLGVNQIEKKGTRKKAQKYLPQNEAELTCFIAGIRPSFKSMYPIFEKRQPFSYGIKSFDKIIQTEFIKDSFIFFQEQLMGALAYAGIPMDETYGLIKAISKKQKKLIMSYKDTFLNGFTNKLVKNENMTKEDAKETSSKIWTIIEDSAQYGFNASHAYCMCCDSLYGAYYKSHYPFEFYEVMLNVYSQKGKKDKVADFKTEMSEAFNIKEGKMKFRLDNRKFTLDKEKQYIHPALVGVKGIGIKDSEELYELRNNKYNNFMELLIDIKEKTSVNKGKLDTLIKLDYFSEFGKSKKLLKIKDIMNSLYSKQQINKNKLIELDLTQDLIKKYAKKETAKLFKDIDMEGMIKELVTNIPNKDISIKDKLSAEIEYLGYPTTTISKASNGFYFVLELQIFKNKRSITYYPKVYNIKNGEIKKMKIKDYILFSENPFKEGNIIKVLEDHKESKRKKDENGKWHQSKTEFNEVVDLWEVY